MDKYERVGNEYAKKNNHTIIKGDKGKIHVYEPNGYLSEWRDEPDETFNGWKEYTQFYIGNNLRRLRRFNNKKHLRRQ